MNKKIRSIIIAILISILLCGCDQHAAFASGNGWKSFYIYDQSGELLYSGGVEKFTRLTGGEIVIYDDHGNKYYTSSQNVIMFGSGSY